MMPTILPQAGCLPFRRGAPGGCEVCLISSIATGQWIAPKGRIDPGEQAEGTAVRETYEEAGVRGAVRARLGVFEQPRGHQVAHIEIFALEVDEVHERWPEQHERRRRWFELGLALQVVDRPEVRKMLDALERWLAEGGGA